MRIRTALCIYTFLLVMTLFAQSEPVYAREADLVSCPSSLLANCDALLHRKNLGTSVGLLIDETMPIVKSLFETCEESKQSSERCESYAIAVRQIEHPQAAKSKYSHKRSDPITVLFSDCFIKLMELEAFRIRKCALKQPPELKITYDYNQWTPQLDQNIRTKMAPQTLLGTPVTAQNDNPVAVVIHGTGTLSLSSALNSLSPARNGQSSCHFLVELDGTIHQLVPIDRIAFHATGLNTQSICIENIRENKPNEPVDPRQIRANRQIIQYLKSEIAQLHGVVPHSEFTTYNGTAAWNYNKKPGKKSRDEPGTEFMRQLRSQLNNCETD